MGPWQLEVCHVIIVELIPFAIFKFNVVEACVRVTPLCFPNEGPFFAIPGLNHFHMRACEELLFLLGSRCLLTSACLPLGPSLVVGSSR